MTTARNSIFDLWYGALLVAAVLGSALLAY
jgi:hypothetical protein